jgi:hypothetical protein
MIVRAKVRRDTQLETLLASTNIFLPLGHSTLEIDHHDPRELQNYNSDTDISRGQAGLCSAHVYKTVGHLFSIHLDF